MSMIRWRSRRGMLELDILLSRFLETRWESLNEVEKNAYLGLLEYPDAELWDIISGRGAVHGAEKRVVELIRTD